MSHHLLPRPRRITASAAPCLLDGVPHVTLDGPETPLRQRTLERSTAQLARVLGHHAPGAAQVRIHCAADPSTDAPLDLTDEAYSLAIDAQGATLTAAHWCGVQRGLASLVQLTTHDTDGAHWPALAIDDAPRFPWRGLLLDPCRHWLPVDDVLRTLDGMAAVKLNLLHLHLTEDQAFRLDLPGLPEFAAVPGNGPAYSAEDIQRVVSHAADRGIRVLPELDLPGHATSWLAAHPELAARSAPDGGFTPRRAFGVSRNALDPTNPATYALIEQVLDAVIALFPDQWLHIGGDEVHAEAWSGVPHIDAYMAEHGLADARALQARFTRRVVGLLHTRGRRAVVWDEALHPDLPPEVLVQGWRGSVLEQAARQAGRALVSSSGYYLDLNWPAASHLAWDPAGDAASQQADEAALHDVPGADRVADGLRWFRDHADNAAKALKLPAADAPGDVHGGEACLWGELVTPALLDLRLWPRLPTIADRLWADDPADHAERLPGAQAAITAATGIDPTAARHRVLAGLGVPAAQRPAVDALLDTCAPLRWYGRHLGDPGLSARTEGTEQDAARGGRPYDTTTPLNRLVDLTDPDAPAAARADDLVTRLIAQHGEPEEEQDSAVVLDLLALAETWRQAGGTVLDLAEDLAACAEAEELADRLMGLADVLEEVIEELDSIDGLDDAQPSATTVQTWLDPVAELQLVAALPVLRLAAAAGLDPEDPL